MKISTAVTLLVTAVALLLAVVAGDGARAVARAQGASSLSSNAAVFATGLDNPRGLTFAPNGHLYVAEAGTGGEASTVGLCGQVPFPLGPMTGGRTGRISAINPGGHRTTVIDGLPSSRTSALTGSEILGPTGVAFVGKTLYALVQAGCSKGHPDSPNAVLRVEGGGASLVADLSGYYFANPVAFPPDEDHDPEGNPYGMASLGGALYVVEANHDELDRVGPGGSVNRVADIAALVGGHITPTTVAAGPDGNLYVGNLSPLPYPDGTAKVYRITPGGGFSVAASGLTAVLGLAFDPLGRLYVLETSTGNTPFPPFLVPGSGRVLRLTGAGTEVVASGLTFPTGMAFGPDNRLYVSHRGYGLGPAAGLGEILRVDVGLPRDEDD